MLNDKIVISTKVKLVRLHTKVTLYSSTWVVFYNAENENSARKEYSYTKYSSLLYKLPLFFFCLQPD